MHLWGGFWKRMGKAHVVKKNIFENYHFWGVWAQTWPTLTRPDMSPLEIGKSVLQFSYRPQTTHPTSSTCLLSAELFYISMVIILGEIWAIVTISFLLHKCREYEVEIFSRIPYREVNILFLLANFHATSYLRSSVIVKWR